MGLLLTNINKSLINFVSYNDRMIQLQTTHRTMPIIQFYAPTFDSSDGEVERFYGELLEVMKVVKKSKITVILGHFNSKVGLETGDEGVG